MIQHHQELLERSSGFNLSISGQLGQIQKIYSTSHFICINLRFPGISRNIYFGRGGGYEGFWDGSEKPKSILRVRDRFLDYLRRYLISGLLIETSVDKKDRILTIVFQRFATKNYFMIFWCGRKSYFLTLTHDDPSIPRLFLSWKGEVTLSANLSESELLSYFDEVGRTQQKCELKSKTKEIEELLLLEEKKVMTDKKVRKRDLFLQKKIKNIQNDLKKVEVYKELEVLAKDTNLDLSESIEILKNNFSLKFKNEVGHFQKLNALFLKIKKLKSAKNILLKREEETKLELAKSRGVPEVLGERIVNKIVGPVWKVDKKNVTSKPSEGEIEEFQCGKNIIAIGRTAQGNDYLRSHWAGANHLWFHLDGVPSAHLAVKIDSIAQISGQELSSIVSLMWEYSQGRAIPEGSLIPIFFTQVKNLKGIKGSPGSVTYKKEKRLSIAYHSEWRNFVTSK